LKVSVSLTPIAHPFEGFDSVVQAFYLGWTSLSRGDLPAETDGAKIGLDLLDKRQTALCYARRSSPLLDLLFASESLFNRALSKTLN
jgi:hypothetical protein